MGIVKSFSEILLSHHGCSVDDIEQARVIQKEYGGTLGNILLNLGAISDRILIETWAEQYGFGLFSELSDGEKEAVASSPLPSSFLLEYSVFPLFETNDAIAFVTHDPMKSEVFLAIQNSSGKTLQIFLATEEELREIRQRYEAVEEEEDASFFEDEVDRLKEIASEAPVIKLVNNIFTKAAQEKVSDIHFESYKQGMKVRYRLDGVLQTVDTIPQKLKQAVTARLKLVSKMNISENRLPQDGRITIKVSGHEIDIRASSVPTAFGESFVLRLLGKQSVDLRLEALGIREENLNLLKKMLKSPNGIILTTGPTGSGKTSTLYAALNHINNEHIKIITVEDPVEYQLEGISQIQVKSSIDYTFANALRSILRQDPDIIMIGEIRDRETAEIAIQSALTGHLVLSTLHTNSALGSITRLLDMGVEFFLLKSSIVGLMAQRLVRRLCDHCKEPVELDQAARELYRIDELMPFVEGAVRPCRAVGCEQCAHTGYAGRLSIMEVVPFDEKLSARFDKDPDFSDLHAMGYRTLQDDGVIKFLEGKTSLDEVTRMT